MKKITSKQVLAWGDGLIHDYLFEVIKDRMSGRWRKGGPYSRRKGSGIDDSKITQVPVTPGGQREIDIEKEKNPANPPKPGSSYDKDIEVGYDGQANDETGPGHKREPPITDSKTVELLTDDPTTINGLFHPSTTDRDKGTLSKTRTHLQSVYNKQPINVKRYNVDSLAN